MGILLPKGEKMELIKINKQEINGAETNIVNARDLHSVLGVGRIYESWIKNRLKQYSFVEGQDFIYLNTQTGTANKIEMTAFVTLDVAKELAMVEKNEKGRLVRKYFIECEKKLNNPITSTEALYVAVGRLVENERSLKLVQVENESDSFTSIQVSTIDALIHEQFKKHGDGKVAGLIKRDLKSKYFEIKSTRTYKEIPRKHFNEVCEYIQNWKLK